MLSQSAGNSTGRKNYLHMTRSRLQNPERILQSSARKQLLVEAKGGRVEIASWKSSAPDAYNYFNYLAIFGKYVLNKRATALSWQCEKRQSWTQYFVILFQGYDLQRKQVLNTKTDHNKTHHSTTHAKSRRQQTKLPNKVNMKLGRK